MSNADRSYSEREVADIIERAVEKQEAARRSATGEGLTLTELERLGTDVGIDPEHLRAAAAELDAVGRTLSRQSSTTKTTIQTERWVDAPLTTLAWEEAVEEMQQRFGPNALSMLGQSSGGLTQQVGASYEWTHTSGLGIQTRMVASERGGRTRLRLSQIVGSASPKVEGLLYGGFGAFLLGIISMIVAKEAFGLAKPDILLVFLVTTIVSMLLLTPLTTALDRRWRGKKHRALEALSDDLAPVFGRAVVTSEEDRQPVFSASVEAVAETPLLQLDDSDVLEDSEEVQERRRTRA